MSKTEYLLACIIEECAEIQQAVAKALMFGLGDGNAEGIVKEYADLKAVVHMLANQDDRIFLEVVDLQAKEKKMKLVNIWHIRKSMES